MTSTMLSLDLNNVVGSVREKFYETLHRLDWIKTPDVDTVWTKEYPAHVFEHNIENLVRLDIGQALEASGAREVHCTVHIGIRAQVNFSFPR